MRTKYMELTEAEAAAVEYSRRMEYKLVALNNQELKKIEEYNAQVYAWLHKLEAQHTCEHNWRWDGRNSDQSDAFKDDAFKCTKCGLIKYE